MKRLRKNKFKVLFASSFFLYLIFCDSCLTFRYSPKKTEKFFSENKINFIDSTIIIDNTPIHYIETGTKNKPSLVFIHGSPGSWNAFEKYLIDSSLIKNYRLIAIDRPGFGYSNFRMPKNLSEQSSLLTTLLDKLINNQKKITLIGHSYGGPLIVKMALDSKNLYDKLVILAGSLDPDAEKPEKWRPVLGAFPLKYIMPGSFLPSNKELWWLKDDLDQLKDELDKLNCKVTIIHGTDDGLVPYSNVPFMEKSFINVSSLKIIPIKDANHFIPWQYYTLIKSELMIE